MSLCFSPRFVLNLLVVWFYNIIFIVTALCIESFGRFVLAQVEVAPAAGGPMTRGYRRERDERVAVRRIRVYLAILIFSRGFG